MHSMLGHVERAAVVASATVVTFASGVVGGISHETVGVISGAVAAVVAAMAWVDYRIERKLRVHNKFDQLRYRQVRKDMRHGFQMLATHLGVDLPPLDLDGENGAADQENGVG